MVIWMPMMRPRMRRRFRRSTLSRCWTGGLLVAVSWGSAFAQTPNGRSKLAVPPSQPVSICELLNDIPRYRGTVVTVTGIYWYGLRQSCAHPLITGEHAWPSALNLVGSTLAMPTVVPSKLIKRAGMNLTRLCLGRLKRDIERRFGSPSLGYSRRLRHTYLKMVTLLEAMGTSQSFLRSWLSNACWALSSGGRGRTTIESS